MAYEMIILDLINNAIIDWFLPWPEHAYLAVATSLLSEDVSIGTDQGNEMTKIFQDTCTYTYL